MLQAGEIAGRQPIVRTINVPPHPDHAVEPSFDPDPVPVSCPLPMGSPMGRFMATHTQQKVARHESESALRLKDVELSRTRLTITSAEAAFCTRF